jgi:hypothetical protein
MLVVTPPISHSLWLLMNSSLESDKTKVKVCIATSFPYILLFVLQWKAQGCHGMEDPTQVENLITVVLSDTALELRVEAAFALGELGVPLAIEPLIRCLEYDPDADDDSLQLEAVDALAKFGQAVVLPLAVVFDNAQQDADSRLFAAMLLAELADTRVLPTLIKAIEDSNDDIANYAIASLAVLETLKQLSL